MALPLLGEDWFRTIILLPMVNCLTVWAVLAVWSWPWRPSGLDESSAYIKERYPEIWRRLHPGGHGYNSLASFAFIAGRYDNGTDQRLNEIKAGAKRLSALAWWPFLLIPVTWVVALAARAAV